MSTTGRWLDLLNQQYQLAAGTPNDLTLLLAVRRFVSFLDTDPRAQLFLKELDYRWEQAYARWNLACTTSRAKLVTLERRIRNFGTELESAVSQLTQAPTEHNSGMHIIGKIADTDWYVAWQHLTDELNLSVLHVDRPPQTQTGHMISHALSITRTTQRLSNNIGFRSEEAAGLVCEAEALWHEYDSAGYAVKYDWMGSGRYALEQLRLVASIVDRRAFTHMPHHETLKLVPFSLWAGLAVTYAPEDLRDDLRAGFQILKTEVKDFALDTAPLLREYLHQVVAELQYLASSRLAHQHLVQRYKVRCENYDWKQIDQLVSRHAQEVQAQPGPKRYEFEDLLTLHFASYLHDNGYAVHYTLRDGVHEPDLLGHDLDPIVVEAKVVGQQYGARRRADWIREGLRALLAYLQKYYSDYGVTEGYLVVFRLGGKNCPMYAFEPEEWKFGQFTIVPVIINVGALNKKKAPEIIKQEDLALRL